MIFENESTNGPSVMDRRTRISHAQHYGGLGKLPPQATDLEDAVLGAIMMERDSFLNVSEFLKADCFYEPRHQIIFECVDKLFRDGRPIDILTVTAELRQVGKLEMIGGAYYITELTNRVASAANIEYHARIIYQKYLQRKLIELSTSVINSAYEDTTDVLELLDQAQMDLFNLNSFTVGQQSEDINTLITEELADLDKPAAGNLTGVGTGLTALDTYTAGWQNGELTIIAARPAMGKTALMMQLARNAAVMFDVPVQVFSLEMTKKQLTKRMISNESEVFLEKFNKKTLTKFDRAELDGKLFKLRNSNLHIDDTAHLNVLAFRAKCIRAKKLHNIGLILIDYIQLMDGSMGDKRNGNRDQELGIISRMLKGVAKDLNVPVIALAQLSRAAENRPGGINRPQLKDLRESGNLEQDADNVYFLYRPEYYGITKDADGHSVEQMAELINAKNRNGAPGTTYFKFRGAVQRFENWVAPTPPTETEQATTANKIIFPESELKSPPPEEDELPF